MLKSDDQGNVTVTGTLHATQGFVNKIARSGLLQETLAVYPVDLTHLRTWDAVQTNLPGTAATDDLGIITGTWGTDAPTLQTSDAKATTVTQRGLFYVMMPPEYVAAETVQIRVNAGMNTTVSDGTATVDLEVYEIDRDGAVGSDLCATAATTINSLTFADKDFTVTATALAPGDTLVVRVTIAITDTATGTAVIGEIGAIELLCDIKG